MDKIKLAKESEQKIIKLSEEKNVYLEGNIIKVLDSDSKEFKTYLQQALSFDKAKRKKRLDITKKVQSQNKELIASHEENEKLMSELKDALAHSESAKEEAQNDLDLLQRKTQFELIGTIIKVALWVIMGVGITATTLYAIALFTGVDTTLLGNTWSNLLGILLTNSFSIVGTIMGVKYSTQKSQESKTS